MNDGSSGPDNGILVTKALQQKAFASGLLVLKPKQAKGNHYVCNDTMVRLKYTVILSALNCFYVKVLNCLVGFLDS